MIIQLIQQLSRQEFEVAIKELLARDQSQPIGEFIMQYSTKLGYVSSLLDTPQIGSTSSALDSCL